MGCIGFKRRQKGLKRLPGAGRFSDLGWVSEDLEKTSVGEKLRRTSEGPGSALDYGVGPSRGRGVGVKKE